MKKILFILFAANLIGCAGNPSRTSNLPPNYSTTLLQKLKNGSKTANRQIANRPSVKQKLLSQYANWKGAPYQYGGLSKRGIDCSGFVQITFQNQFGRHLPRTTQQQAKVGSAISKSQLQAGDLVFFKTGYNKRHVGIALGNSEFMHASTSKGVIISNLENSYWLKHYRFSVRL